VLITKIRCTANVMGAYLLRQSVLFNPSPHLSLIVSEMARSQVQVAEPSIPQKFHRVFTLLGTDEHGPLKVTYAIGGPEHGKDVPTILFCAGMLATRWMAEMINWLAEKEGVRVLFIDR
jgi:hypothetical protein